ncbi:hypothetical protein F443_21780 [Phytophthora nicotianae P1569]|uniref:Uncharacterized protein n=2 Tax=Phytophthora nicotianae TaxID=4792 RepID=V9DWD1_PHYNI|nr:hypothetical protein F443_21780 [Phytophthora nicotianae P1569]
MSTYTMLVDELLDANNFLESHPKLSQEEISILNSINSTLYALKVPKVVSRTILKQEDEIEDPESPMQSRPTSPEMESVARGRGLKGAGLQGYNLRDIEGTGMASDLVYKRLGSKFVQVERLNDGELKIVYPNRKLVGMRRNQEAYNKLPMDDKQLFHEILRITHIQYEFKNPLQDPREALKQEYIKLKGEIMLGNDNPEIVEELKTKF